MRFLRDHWHGIFMTAIIVIGIALTVYHAKVCLDRTGYPFCQIVSR